MAEARFKYEQQQLNDKTSEFLFREAAYGQPISGTFDSDIRCNKNHLNAFLERKMNEKIKIMEYCDKMYEKFIEETMAKKVNNSENSCII